MQKYAIAYLIKLLFTGVIIFSLFSMFYHLSIMELFLMALLISGFTFIIELFLFTRLGHTFTPVADFFVVFLLLLLFGSMLIPSMPAVVISSFAGAYLIGIAEALYHIYFEEKVMDRDTQIINQLQIEFSEELQPELDEKKNDK